MLFRQRGLGGTLVAVVLIIVAVSALALLALSRVRSSAERGGQVTSRFAVLHDALVQFVAANGRLPCPADPSLDDGLEGAAVSGVCPVSTQEGTVPWQTIGARRDDAIDPWGGKISYRVYTGNAGSLTQAGGASMVRCDLIETSPLGVTSVIGSEGGLCRPAPPDGRLTVRDTPPANYLLNKELAVTEFGSAQSGVAYVLLSHGASGLGAYTTAGVRREMPAAGGDERSNTNATGPFVIKAFSSPEVTPTDVAHFDDHVSYRRLDELIRLAGQGAREWPEEITASVGTLFDESTVETAVGQGVTPGTSVGTVTVNFVGVVATGIASGSTPTDISFAVVGANGGIGVAGGGSALVQSSANESLQLDVEGASKLGVTLADFGVYSGTFIEIVQFQFFSNGAVVGATRFGVGCQADGGLASFTMDVGGIFDRVVITPLPAFDTDTFTFSGITALLLSEMKTCPSTEATCVTSLATPAPSPPGNTCTLF